MRAVSSLISFIFHVVVLAAACLLVYVALEPDSFFYVMAEANELLETGVGRVGIAAAGLFTAVLFFVRVLAAVSKPDRTYVINRDNEGTLSVSGSTIRKLIGDIATKMYPRANVESLSVKPQNDGLKIALKIKVDMANTNLKEYSAELNGKIREYFDDSLGIKIDALDIQASADPSADSSGSTALVKSD